MSSQSEADTVIEIYLNPNLDLAEEVRRPQIFQNLESESDLVSYTILITCIQFHIRFDFDIFISINVLYCRMSEV